MGLLGHMVDLFLVFKESPYCSLGFPSGKESICNAGAAGEGGSIHGLGRSPGGGHGE